MLCGIKAIKNATDVQISIEEMNYVIDYLQQKDKTKKTSYGIKNVGALHIRTIQFLITTKAQHTFTLMNFQHEIVSVKIFLNEYWKKYNNVTLILMTWATNGRYDLDDGYTHYIVIKEQMIFNDDEAPITVSENNLSLFGEDTRLKVYIIEPCESKAGKNKIKEHLIQKEIKSKPHIQNKVIEGDISRILKKKRQQERQKENKRTNVINK